MSTIKKRHASSDTTSQENMNSMNGHSGPPRGGWVYGSFNTAADLSNGTMQRRKNMSRTASFDRLVKRSDSTVSTKSDVSDIQFPHPGSSGGKYSMLEFSMMYFRQNIDRYEVLQAKQRGVTDSIKLIEGLKLSTIKRRFSLGKSDKKKNGKAEEESWSWREQAEAIKWTNKPIESSLLKLLTEEMSSLAVECFMAILMVSGDHELQGRYSPVDCIVTLLKSCHSYLELRDEIYCQLAKQTTSNKSANPDSCTMAWRIFTLLACWFPCSDVLKPYLLTYLQQHASDPSRTYHTIGLTTLNMLKKTLRQGGRRNIPSSDEISAFLDGKLTRKQRIFPCGASEESEIILLHVSPATLAREVVEETCHRLGVISTLEAEEFALFMLPCAYPIGQHPIPQGTRLKRDEYIMDVITEWRLHHEHSCVLLKRICWFTPLRLDSMLPGYMEMVYQQVAQQYLDGWLITPAPKNTARSVPARMLDEIVKIASMMWKISDQNDSQLNIDTVEHFVPDRVISLDILEPEQLLVGVKRFLVKLNNSQATLDDMKIDVLHILCRWPMFGATFHYTKCLTETKLSGRCVLAVNRAGIHFLEYGSHSLILSYPYTEVLSSRKVAPNSTEQVYLDVKVGNNRIQKVLRLETMEASDISHLIGQYIKMLNNTPKSLTSSV